MPPSRELPGGHIEPNYEFRATNLGSGYGGMDLSVSRADPSPFPTERAMRLSPIDQESPHPDRPHRSDGAEEPDRASYGGTGEQHLTGCFASASKETVSAWQI